MDLPFLAEYAKSGRASCRGCRSKIDKDSLRIAAMVQSPHFDGRTPHWYHHHCFFTMQRPKTVDGIAHFESLRWDDQQLIRAKVGAGALIGIAGKRRRKRNAPGKVQSESGNIPDKKPNLEDETDRVDDKLEKRMRTQNKVMFTYRDKLKELSRNELQLLLGHNKQGIPAGEGRMLDRLSDIMAFGALQPCPECKSGQFVCDKLGYMCRGNLTEWTKCNLIVKEPKRYPFLVPDKLAEKYTFLATYEYVPRIRLFKEVSLSVVEKDEDDNYVSCISSGSMFAPMPRKIKLKLKDGGAVDPDSGLNNRAHIYQKGNEKFSVVLGLTDIQLKRNSYYKLQLLQSDSGNQYWLFRSWGRIGTTIGSNKVEEMDFHAAQNEFMRLYEEKSGNPWHNRDNFVKMPGKLYPIDVDYGDQDAELQLNSESDVGCKLSKPVQDLIKLIFDVKSMKKVMSEFELDTTKMPLGKLSKTQLQNAFGVLSELQQLVESKGSRGRFIDASNRFYTYVPHSFGLADPPIIDTIEMIKQKIYMIENLMELEIAYGLIKSTGGKNTMDAYYEMLKTEIDILDREAEEFKIIQEYVKNTHAATHNNYELEIEDVFVVKRQGEENQFKPFSELHNRKLLWHGSRVTNYAGILSQGLRIAPPEAPVSGYMFGKGIYFADMVSKSANYCFTTRKRNTGLLLLCEVALGEMLELSSAEYIEKLPIGKHSVKGIGNTEPDPQHFKEISAGVHVPIGKGVDMNTSSLLYNEYIVYDVAQVNIKYLLKMKFKYEY